MPIEIYKLHNFQKMAVMESYLYFMRFLERIMFYEVNIVMRKI